MGLLKNKLRIGAPEEKRAVRLKPETVSVGHADALVQAIKQATVLNRLREAPLEMREPCHVGCDCGPCQRGDCNRGVACRGGRQEGRRAFGMPYWRY